MKFSTIVTGIGPFVEEFIKDGNFMIVFNDNAPPELKEMAVLHTQAEMPQEVKVGDIVRFGDQELIITGVGDEANHTLKTMGHCTFRFNGAKEPELPGQIELQADGIPPKVNVGDVFEIEFK